MDAKVDRKKCQKTGNIPQFLDQGSSAVCDENKNKSYSETGIITLTSSRVLNIQKTMPIQQAKDHQKNIIEEYNIEGGNMNDLDVLHYPLQKFMSILSVDFNQG